MKNEEGLKDMCFLSKLRMGFAETDITPDAPVTTVGFNRADNISKGILDCLTAQVCVWKNDEICCLVTIDSIGFNKKEADMLRDKIGAIIKAPKEKVMLSFSHTHSAPNADIEKEYYAGLCTKICQAAEKALSSMSEAAVGWGNAEAVIGVNRRDTGVEIDRRVGILKIHSGDSDKLRLIILRLTAHCNVLKSDNYLISADYFGAVRKIFKEKYHCPVMVVQGSAGNIAPKYYNASFVPVDGQGEGYINCEDALDKMAREVFGSVEKVFDKICTKRGVRAGAYSKYITLQSKVPSMSEAREIAAEARKFCGIDGKKWLNEIERLQNKGISVQEEHLEIQYFCVGDWCLCGIPNETMVEFALETERLLRNPYFYFNGYTNGCGSYFPTKEEYDLGGYEVYWAMLIYYADYGRVYPYMREADDAVISFVVRMDVSQFSDFYNVRCMGEADVGDIYALCSKTNIT